MHFEGEFRVPGPSDEVIRRFADVPRMARCMPGAVVEPQAEDGSWPGAMLVAFGPKKISFKGRVTCDFDLVAKTGVLHGRGSADMRAARIGVKVSFALRDAEGAPAPTTIVKLTSDAELGGVLADFARTGGVPVANAIMQDFARRAAEEFAKDATPPSAASAAVASPPQGAPRHAQPPEASQAASPEQTQAPVVAPSPQTSPPAPLSAHRLLWVVIKHTLRQWAQRLGLAPTRRL